MTPTIASPESVLDPSGFRLRGLEMTRIETFTDAAFAFALTLLVISLDPPSSFAALGDALRSVPVFVLSGTLLMMFWWGHHQWSRRYGLDDGPTIILSAVLVFTVLVYVYPLRFVFSMMMAWIERLTGWPLGGGGVTIAAASEVNAIFAIYGVGFVAMCLCLVMLHVHAWRKRDELALTPLERGETLANGGAWLIVSLAGVLSLTLALSLPPSWAGAPGWAYMLLPIAMPTYARWINRRMSASQESAGDASTPR